MVPRPPTGKVVHALKNCSLLKGRAVGSGPGCPARLTASAIGREVATMQVLFTSKNRLPLTWAKIAGEIETVEAAAVRRMAWAVRSAVANGTPLTLVELRLKARYASHLEGLARVMIEALHQALSTAEPKKTLSGLMRAILADRHGAGRANPA